jgi:hypothetical protein
VRKVFGDFCICRIDRSCDASLTVRLAAVRERIKLSLSVTTLHNEVRSGGALWCSGVRIFHPLYAVSLI